MERTRRKMKKMTLRRRKNKKPSRSKKSVLKKR